MAEEKATRKTLSPKQKRALELLTNGQGLTYKQICEEINVNPKTLWDWRNEPVYTLFQAEYKRLENEKWLATVEAARQAAFDLCKEKNQKMVEFVLKNDGLNPTQKVEADLNTDINIIIE